MSAMSTDTSSTTRAEDTLRAGRDHLIRYGGEFPDFLVERAEGSWLTTEDGRRILDFTSGQMCSTLGHGHPAILDAHAGGGRAGRAPVQRLRLARRHRARARADGAAAGAARPRDVPVDRRRGERGGAAAGKAPHRRPRGARLRGLVARDDRRRRVEHLQRRPPRLRARAARHDGAADAEPLPLPDRPLPRPLRPDLPGAPAWRWPTPSRSARPPPRSSSRSSARAASCRCPTATSRALKQHCEERGMLLVVDEAQTALGRVGTMFAFEQHDVVPDFVDALEDARRRPAAVGYGHHRRDRGRRRSRRASCTSPRTSRTRCRPPSGAPCCDTVLAEELGARAVADRRAPAGRARGAAAPPRADRRRPRRRADARRRPRLRPRDARAGRAPTAAR